ncbi:unnamed protein product [Toxocara canis]|uniref:Uncharacterized protein n=1 Tax=Toxocara canis TaxID=6265 RepID=A0A183UQJ9_TOXCA|nr:unnamed protein product [Toxocara canis]
MGSPVFLEFLENLGQREKWGGEAAQDFLVRKAQTEPMVLAVEKDRRERKERLDMLECQVLVVWLVQVAVMGCPDMAVLLESRGLRGKEVKMGWMACKVCKVLQDSMPFTMTWNISKS